MAKRQYAHVKPELLFWARTSLRMGLDEAAERLDVDPVRLGAWEKGERKPTVNQLRHAAAVYRRPLAAFFLPEPPKDFRVPHDFRTIPGEPEPALSPELLAAIRLAEYRRQLAVELAEDLQGLSSLPIGTASVEENADLVAAKARESLSVDLSVQRSWTTKYDALNGWKNALERLGVLVFHFNDVEVEEARGFSLGETPFPVIALNGKDSPLGRIFSLMHELAHLLLNRPGISDQREYRAVTSLDQRIEVFCNQVAGEVLVPGQDLVQDPVVRSASRTTEWDDATLTNLARAYWVSREVILRRLLVLGKTNDEFYREKRGAFRGLGHEEEPGGFLTVAMKVIRDVGKPFLRIVLNAYYEQAITTSDLSEYLGARIKHLPEIEKRLFGANVLTGGDR